MATGIRLNVECPHDRCQDRLNSWEQERKVASITEERDRLYSQMETLKNALKDKEESLVGIFKELLKDITITDGGKTMSQEEITKKISGWSKTIDEDKISAIVKDNLEKQHQIHNLSLELESYKQDTQLLKVKVVALEEERKLRESKDIQLIRDTSQAQVKMQDLVKEKENLEIEVKRLDNHKSAILQDISSAREEAKGIYKSYQDATQGLKDAQEEVNFIRKEFSHYKRYMPSKIGGFFGIMPLMKKTEKALEKGRLDHAKKLWIKVQTKYLTLSDQEKRLITKEYDALMQKLEPKKVGVVFEI